MTASALLEIEAADFAPRFGKVRSVSSGLIEASGPDGVIGEICAIEGGSRENPVLAEIVALDESRVLLSPLDSTCTVPLRSRVIALGQGSTVPIGDAFAGRAVDAFGQKIDGRDSLRTTARHPLQGIVPAPLERSAPTTVAVTGIKAIDGLLTLGRGQRIGIIAASGVGKTSLMEQLATQTQADHVILCLVGERGREVQSIWRSVETRKDRDRFTIVAATSDESAAHRVRAPSFALALAEHWRSKGRHVLLFVDSVTRLAMALREIGLAAGSPPTVRAYTPNVFSALPRMVERCGALIAGGAITAVMTVLSETDDADDPIVELMKSLLDGHIILSRVIAEQGRFPAIDVIRSVSRGIEKRIEPSHAQAHRELIAMLSTYEESRVMVETGAYRGGTNPILDRAIHKHKPAQDFLSQGMEQAVPFEQSVAELCALARTNP
ncbi:MAG TPA: FliI/YscN family ATPase [Sphingomicrobium sp.]|nr:FliI/YscN family ATPase [Sphingomicrobium sp.]